MHLITCAFDNNKAHIICASLSQRLVGGSRSKWDVRKLNAIEMRDVRQLNVIHGHNDYIALAVSHRGLDPGAFRGLGGGRERDFIRKQFP